MKPLVSVIMPVYNAEKYIRKAIDSILGQTYTHFELILIDDCPTDASMDIVNEYSDERIHVIHNKENSGIAYSRNTGLENSKGEYIALMDDDDIALPYRFEREVEFLEDRADIDIVGGRCEIIDSEDNFIKKTITALNNPKYIRAHYLFRNAMINGTAMIRKELVDNFHLRYKDNCLGMEDYRFWIDCSKVGNISNMDEIFLKYRARTDNETGRVALEQSEERKKLYAQFQRESLYASGFRLNEEQLAVINKLMTEVNGVCESIDELKKFHAALLEIVHQARKMQCDNTEEILILCKKLLADKVRTMEILWD